MFKTKLGAYKIVVTFQTIFFGINMGVENFSLGMKVLGEYIQMPIGKIRWFYMLAPL